jgi:hypothetical protein
MVLPSGLAETGMRRQKTSAARRIRRWGNVSAMDKKVLRGKVLKVMMGGNQGNRGI